jgi:hypothetical protein
MMNRNYIIYNGDVIIEEGARDVSWSEVRQERKQWFEVTDLWYLKDRWDQLSTVKKGELNSFREELRDLPQAYDDPNEAADNFPEPQEWFKLEVTQ